LTREEIEALGTDLLAADENGDAIRLASIAWRLYSIAGTASAEVERLHGTLRCRCAADFRAVPV
jgi:hypothetical protein